MQELIDLYRHNTWPNERVVALAQDVDARLLEAEAPGTRDRVKVTLAHLARVEYVYLTMIQGKPRQSVESREDYEGHDLAWMRRHLQEIGQALSVPSRPPPPRSLRRLDIAEKAPVTARDGLLQVLTNSSQHRGRPGEPATSLGVKRRLDSQSATSKQPRTRMLLTQPSSSQDASPEAVRSVKSARCRDRIAATEPGIAERTRRVTYLSVSRARRRTEARQPRRCRCPGLG